MGDHYKLENFGPKPGPGENRLDTQQQTQNFRKTTEGADPFKPSALLRIGQGEDFTRNFPTLTIHKPSFLLVEAAVGPK